MKKLELIVKRVETDKDSFYAYSSYDEKTKKWYKVKFVNGCKAPKHNKIEDRILRAYIGLDEKDNFNMRKDERDFNGKTIVDNILFITSFTALSEEDIDRMVEASKERIKEFRDKEMENKKDFCASDVDASDIM